MNRTRLVTTIALAGLMAAGCNSTIAHVDGTVLDSRSNQPVAGAKVTAGKLSGTTGGGGVFSLRAVPKDAKLLVEAANYASVTGTPAPTAVKFRLEPIPVTGTVTSGLTGQGLHAHVGTVETADDGTFTVYGIGPGATVTVTAPLYKDATATVDPNRTVALKLYPARVDPNATISAVPGYGITPAPPSVAAAVLTKLNTNAVLSDAKPALAYSVVQQGSTRVGAIFCVAFDPGYVELPGFADEFLKGLVAGVGGTSTATTLNGITAQIGTGRNGVVLIAWQQATTFLGVTGTDRARLEALATAIINANK